MQSALNNHYASEKLSHLVCKHHNEWAYGGQYLSGLIAKLDQFYTKAIEKDADGKVADNKEELDAIKQERKDAFEAKVEQLALWEDIEVRKSSCRSKYINGSLQNNPVVIGGYLTYKLGKWIYERIAYGDKKEEAIPLSPFPIDNPVVYHFHPVAFVEQMRRMDMGLSYEIYHTGKIIQSGDLETAKEVKFIYYDKNGTKYDLGIYELFSVSTYANGKKRLPKGANLTEYKVVYSNVYKCNLYYKKLNGTVKTIDISEHMSGNRNGSSDEILRLSYKSKSFKINFYAQTSRRYAKPKCFAAIIGAVIDTSYVDIKINGFTSKDGTGRPSLTHPRGMKVDIKILIQRQLILQ